MIYGSSTISSEHSGKTPSATRYAFYKQHFSEAKYSEVMWYIKCRRINYQTPVVNIEQDLIDRINSAYSIGDNIKVVQDDKSVGSWTVRAPASLVSNQAVIWANEHRSCYLANRVVFNH